MELHGIVTAPDGTALGDVEVQAVSGRTPHDPNVVLQSTRTAADGTFRLEPVLSDAVQYVVVRGLGGVRTFDRRADEPVGGRVDVGTLVLRSTREVSFRVLCTGGVVPSAADTGRGMERVQVYGQGSGDLVVDGYLSDAQASSDAESGALPARAGYVSEFALDATVIGGTFGLPVGTHRVVLRGSCGNAEASVVVPARGPAVFEQTLPVAGYDATLVLRAEPCGEAVRLYAWSARGHERALVAAGRTECGEEMRVARLPPGRVSLAIGSRECLVALESGRVTEVSVDGEGRCVGSAAAAGDPPQSIPGS